jgi:hypothetical protein
MVECMSLTSDDCRLGSVVLVALLIIGVTDEIFWVGMTEVVLIVVVVLGVVLVMILGSSVLIGFGVVGTTLTVLGTLVVVVEGVVVVAAEKRIKIS